MPMPAGPSYENTSSPFSSWWLNHVSIRVPDFDAGVKWYSEVLDFRLVHTWAYTDTITFGYLSPAVDNRTRLELMGGPGAERKPLYADLNDSLLLYGFHHVGFRVDEVDATFAALQGRGVTFLSEPLDFEACNRRFAVFADPWHNVIEIDAPILPDSPVRR